MVEDRATMTFFLPSSRVLWVLLAFLAGSTWPGGAQAKGPDFNALGFKAYTKGDYKKAHGLFEKELKKNPEHAFARLNRARTTTLLNQGKEEAGDFDYCAYETNWIFQALADLSKAVEVNRSLILPKIDEDQKGLKALKEHPEYKNWRKAVSVLAGEAEAVEQGVRDTSEWLYQAPGQLPVSVAFKPDQKVVEEGPTGEQKPAGQWSLKGGQVELTPEKGKPQAWKVSAEKFFFNQGKDFIFQFQLVPVAAEAAASGWLGGPLKAGPLMGDCE